MAGHHLECLRCRSDNNWLSSWKVWSFTFVRRFLCARVAVNIMPTDWLNGLVQLPNAVSIPHGIEIAADDSSYPRLSGPPLIIFQGRLVTTKGLRLLLEAAAILRSQNRAFEILVIGDGPERAPSQELVEKLQLSSCVHFAGRIATADLEPSFAGASIVAVPSLGGEVFGLVLAESMSRGLPIVAANLGSFVEVLGDAGLTFRAGDGKDLARQMLRLLDDSSFASALRRRARSRVFELYSRNRMIEEHAQLYRRLSRAERREPA